MPTIRIDYDKNQVARSEIEKLVVAAHTIVQEETAIEDVFVYAQSPEICYKAAPIELYIEITAAKILERDSLFEHLQERFSEWKKETQFPVPINITLTAKDWQFAVDI